LNRITSRDVARHAGVSQATVSIVLNSTTTPIRVSPATRVRVLAAAAASSGEKVELRFAWW
jgi:DNA-binding LacI/PurR family transcriptional regulator